VCLEVPFSSLKSASSSLVAEMQRLNIHRPGLSIASAVNDRLGYLLPGSREEVNPGGPIDRSQMYSEAARRDTFVKWPHMNYKYIYLLLKITADNTYNKCLNRFCTFKDIVGFFVFLN
jgi:baculoviral IAP repeat-containing protein 6